MYVNYNIKKQRGEFFIDTVIRPYNLDNFDYMQKLRNFFKSITLEKETTLRESVFKAVKTHTKESIEYLIESIQWLVNLKIPTKEKESFIAEHISLNFISLHCDVLELLETLKLYLCEIILELF